MAHQRPPSTWFLLMLLLLFSYVAQGFQPCFGLGVGVKKSSFLTRKKGASQIQLRSARAEHFDETVMERYACTRFQRSSATRDWVIKEAGHCLELARRAPSGFNAQPYKLILVHSPQSKEALSKYCIGRNKDRVKDSDCTAIFLADREWGRSLGQYGRFIRENRAHARRPLTWFTLRRVQALILLFSSGFPLPRILATPMTFAIRCCVSLVSALTFRKIVVPTLSSAETWSIKNTMLVAMSYMLGCTSRGIATCPMEGYNAGGIRRMLKIPRRYAIPIIISTGTPYTDSLVSENAEASGGTNDEDDVGMSHAKPGSKGSTPRYNAENIIYGDKFGGNFNFYDTSTAGS